MSPDAMPMQRSGPKQQQMRCQCTGAMEDEGEGGEGGDEEGGPVTVSKTETQPRGEELHRKTFGNELSVPKIASPESRVLNKIR
jgi:hypothetical protein